MSDPRPRADAATPAAGTVPADIHVTRTLPPRVRRPATIPGVLIGAGLGGFVDGIVLHQILRWHNMLSAVLPPTTMRNMEVNMVFDGYFHAGVWLVTLLGVLGLWAAGRRGALFPTAGQLLGQLLFGWAVFNLVEGTVDHHILQLHHVIDRPQHEPALDWVFLAVSAALLLAGAALMRPKAPTAPAAPRAA